MLAWSAGVTIAFKPLPDIPARHRNPRGRRRPGQHVRDDAGAAQDAADHRTRAMITLTRAAGLSGSALALPTRRIPWTRHTADLVRLTRFVNPAADPAQLSTLMKEFCTTHPAWYAELRDRRVRARSGHVVEGSTCRSRSWPASGRVRGRSSALSGGAAQRVKGSRYRELDATHFLPLEFPDIVLNGSSTWSGASEPRAERTVDVTPVDHDPVTSLGLRPVQQRVGCPHSPDPPHG
ncbi:hypothetical protein [Aeromicrobium sp. UC242_57]|uniref:hypothetical protein n=1 Tax=Aeromicrobium sp. UC242_57 TaxID=3374624 RepID=UPI0037BB3572